MAEIPIEALIREAAQSRGVDPDLALKIAQKESDLYPRAKNKRSSAYGLFQITDPTWKQYGGTDENRYDLMDNIRIGVDIIASNRDRFLREFKRAPNAGELYTMHVFGQTGGPRIMRQDPNALMADVVSPKVIKANKIPKTQTVGEFIGMLQKKMGSKLDTQMAKRRVKEQTSGTVPMPAAPKETLRETREPVTPVSTNRIPAQRGERLQPLAEAPEGEDRIGVVTKDVLEKLGPNYQAALAAMTLGDTREDDDDDEESLSEQFAARQEDEQRRAEVPRSAALAGLDLSYQSPFGEEQPVMMAKGGEVSSDDDMGPSNPIPAKEMMRAFASAQKGKVTAGDIEALMAGLGMDEGMLGVNVSKLSSGDREQLFKGLVAQYGTRIGELGVSGSVIRPIDAPAGMYAGSLSASYPLGKGSVNAAINALRTPESTKVTGYNVGYGGRVGPGELSAGVNIPSDSRSPSGEIMYRIPFASGGLVHRADGSPPYGEGVPDSGPVTADTRRALSLRQGLSAAELMRMLKSVGAEGVSNLESIARGQGAMLLGSPGDMESIFRSDKKRIFPTSDEVLKKFSTRATLPTREAEGFEAVGMYVPPLIPSSAVSTGAELIKQGANKVSSTVKNLLPKKPVLPADLFPTSKLSSQELLKQLKEVDSAALERGKQEFLKDSAEKRRMYHGTRHSVGLPDIQVLEDGTIKQVYSDRHGFSEFKPRTADMTFLSPDPSFSETFAGVYKHASGEKYLPHGGTIYPVYAKVKKPFDYESLEQVKELADEVIRLGKKKNPNLANLYKTDPDFPFWATKKDYAIDALSDGSWATLENPIVIQAIKNLKYDGVYMKESGVKNLGVFNPNNIKSATGNIGTYDVKNPDIRKAHGGVVHRRDGSPIYGEVADSGPITADTRRALSLPQGLSAAELMRMLKGVAGEGVSNLESTARGSVATVPGLVGDIESFFRSDKERKFATTPEVERQYLPSRLTKPTAQSEGFIEAGTFIDPTIATKIAKPVAKGTAKAALAGFKSVSPQLENILEKSAFGLDKMYVVKPTGGTTYPASMVSKIDDYLERIQRGVTKPASWGREYGVEALKGKDAKKIIEFVSSKGRDYLTKRYGSPKDEMKEAILDGRVALTGADAELFPPNLLAQAREGNPVALERFEEIYDKSTGIQGTVVFDNLADPKAKVAREKEWEKLLKEGALPHEINLNVVGRGRKDLGTGYGSDAELELRSFLSGEQIPPKEASGVMYAARHGEPIYDMDSMYPRLEYLDPDTVVPALASVVDDLDRMSFPEALIRGMQKTNVFRNDEAAIRRAAQGKSVPVELFQRGIEPIAPIGDFSLVRVKSPFAVRMEGAAMRHSIGDYALDAEYGLGGKKAFESGDTQVFSIRSAEGKPMVSMDAEIDYDIDAFYGHPKIDQIRAIFNSKPNEQEKQAVFKAFDALYPNLDSSDLEKFLPVVKYKNTREGLTLPVEDRTEIDWWQEYTNYLRKQDAR